MVEEIERVDFRSQLGVPGRRARLKEFTMSPGEERPRGGWRKKMVAMRLGLWRLGMRTDSYSRAFALQTKCK